VGLPPTPQKGLGRGVTEVRMARTCEQLPELHLQILPDFVFCLWALNTRTQLPQMPSVPARPAEPCPAQASRGAGRQCRILPYLHTLRRAPDQSRRAAPGTNPAQRLPARCDLLWESSLEPAPNFLSYQLKFWQRLSPHLISSRAPWQQAPPCCVI